MKNGAQLSTNPKAALLDELENLEYRRAFVEAHSKDTVAFQIRQLRIANDWEQRDLAQKLGNPKLQPMVSRYENPDYGRYSITTLLELAEVFDVALVVRFAPYSELVEWDWKSNASTLAPPSYSKDKRLAQLRKSVSQPSSGSKLASFPPSPASQDMQETPPSLSEERQGKPKTMGESPNAALSAVGGKLA
jgi:transcriptional regulator with XRE-family HTH domain